MSQQFLQSLSPKQLLQMTGPVIDELRRRGIARTGNNPLIDYTEFLVASKYGYKLAPPSEQGYDLEDERTGRRYEVKGRRVSKENSSRQLSAIRGFDAHYFYALIAVVLTAATKFFGPWRYPGGGVKSQSRLADHTNSITLLARDNLLQIEGVRDLTDDLRGFELPRTIKKT